MIAVITKCVFTFPRHIWQDMGRVMENVEDLILMAMPLCYQTIQLLTEQNTPPAEIEHSAPVLPGLRRATSNKNAFTSGYGRHLLRYGVIIQ